MLCRCSSYPWETTIALTLNGAERGGVWIVLFSEVTPFDDIWCLNNFVADCKNPLHILRYTWSRIPRPIMWRKALIREFAYKNSALISRLALTSDRVGVGAVDGVKRELMTLWKSKIEVVRRVISAIIGIVRTFSFSSDSAYDLALFTI